jgi:membrane-bound serine protease (ClpP class)
MITGKLFKFSLLFLLFLAANLALASSTPPASVAGTTSSGAPAVDANPSSAGSKNPFSLNVTIGFPADISIHQPLTSSSPNDSVGKKAILENTSSKTRVYEYGINAELGNRTPHHTSAALKQAMNLDVDMVYIHLNTFADFDETASDIRNKLSEFNKPMTVFLDNGTNSSGAIISLSRDSGSTDKKNQVTTSVYRLRDNQFRDKYKTYVNSILQKTAKNREEPACVTDVNATPITENNASQQKESLTPSTNLVVYNYQPRIYEKALDFLLHPVISLLLILIMAFGLFLELNKPGTGFPLFASIGAAFLLFIPLHVDGFATYSEMLLFCSGLGLAIIQFIFWKSRIMLSSGLILAAVGLTLSLCPTLNLSYSNLTGMLPLLKALGIVLSASIVMYVTTIFTSRRNNRLGAAGSALKQKKYYAGLRQA